MCPFFLGLPISHAEVLAAVGGSSCWKSDIMVAFPCHRTRSKEKIQVTKTKKWVDKQNNDEGRRNVTPLNKLKLTDVLLTLNPKKFMEISHPPHVNV